MTWSAIADAWQELVIPLKCSVFQKNWWQSILYISNCYWILTGLSHLRFKQNLYWSEAVFQQKWKSYLSMKNLGTLQPFVSPDVLNLFVTILFVIILLQSADAIDIQYRLHHCGTNVKQFTNRYSSKVLNLKLSASIYHWSNMLYTSFNKKWWIFSMK